MAKVLSKRYKNLDELAKANEEDLLKIPDVGPVAAKSIVDFFMNDKNKAEIELLRQDGLNFDYLGTDTLDVNSFFYGKTIVLTGTLTRYSRQEMTDIWKESVHIAQAPFPRKQIWLSLGLALDLSLIKQMNSALRSLMKIKH